MDAAPVAAHLVVLAAAGVGLRPVAAAAAVSPATVAAVRAGTRPAVAADVAARLLAVPCVPAPGARVPATKTHRFVDSLRREGYTARELAWWAGYRSQQWQIAGRVVTARTAARVARLYRRLADT